MIPGDEIPGGNSQNGKGNVAGKAAVQIARRQTLRIPFVCNPVGSLRCSSAQHVTGLHRSAVMKPAGQAGFSDFVATSEPSGSAGALELMRCSADYATSCVS